MKNDQPQSCPTIYVVVIGNIPHLYTLNVMSSSTADALSHPIL